MLGKTVAQTLHASLKRLSHIRRIEDQVTDLVPQVRLILTADDADGALESLARQPQLAVQP